MVLVVSMLAPGLPNRTDCAQDGNRCAQDSLRNFAPLPKPPDQSREVQQERRYNRNGGDSIDADPCEVIHPEVLGDSGAVGQGAQDGKEGHKQPHGGPKPGANDVGGYGGAGGRWSLLPCPPCPERKAGPLVPAGGVESGFGVHAVHP